MNEYLPQFLGFATVHLLSMISPGPDFMMVLRTSLRGSRRTALWVAVGIACGEAIHCTYSVLGLGVLVQGSEDLMTLLRFLGGAYLIYIGVMSVMTKKQMPSAIGAGNSVGVSQTSAFSAWKTGFLTNITNVKAAFFTISCFAVFLSPDVPLSFRALLGLFVVATTILWFSCVVFCLTHGLVQLRFMRMKHWIERACGAFLIFFGVKLAIGDVMMLT
jgi:RhtB (resistance to homoserine/threonine) family protein